MTQSEEQAVRGGEESVQTFASSSQDAGGSPYRSAASSDGSAQPFRPPSRAASGGLSGLPVGPVVLGALILLGLGAVYVLKTQCGPQAAGADEVAAEQEVVQFLQRAPEVGGAADSRALVKEFYYDARERQIPLAALPNNPFVFRTIERGKINDGVVSNPDREEHVSQTEEQRRREAQIAAAVRRLRGLSLQTTMGDTAMVSDVVVREGDTIQGWKVEKVLAGRILMSWRDQKCYLTMPTD